jgi:hypothetical protein
VLKARCADLLHCLHGLMTHSIGQYGIGTGEGMLPARAG